MSLYNQLFGENKDAGALLAMIGLSRTDFQRYRDAWLNKDGNIITVFTRLGGDNRKTYQHVISSLRNNKWFKIDFDDDFDNTYAYFQFNIPNEYKEVCKEMSPEEERPSFEEMFKKELNEMNTPGTKAYETAEKIAKQLAEGLSGGSTINFIEM